MKWQKISYFMNMVKLKQNLSSDLDLISRGYPGEPEYVTGLMTIIYTRGVFPGPFFFVPLNSLDMDRYITRLSKAKALRQ